MKLIITKSNIRIIWLYWIQVTLNNFVILLILNLLILLNVYLRSCRTLSRRSCSLPQISEVLWLFFVKLVVIIISLGLLKELWVFMLGSGDDGKGIKFRNKSQGVFNFLDVDHTESLLNWINANKLKNEIIIFEILLKLRPISQTIDILYLICWKV